jgi:hypothetical protein
MDEFLGDRHCLCGGVDEFVFVKVQELSPLSVVFLVCRESVSEVLVLVNDPQVASGVLGLPGALPGDKDAAELGP